MAKYAVTRYGAIKDNQIGKFAALNFGVLKMQPATSSDIGIVKMAGKGGLAGRHRGMVG